MVGNRQCRFFKSESPLQVTIVPRALQGEAQNQFSDASTSTKYYYRSSLVQTDVLTSDSEYVSKICPLRRSHEGEMIRGDANGAGDTCFLIVASRLR
jgi:hypothetical protein